MSEKAGGGSSKTRATPNARARAAAMREQQRRKERRQRALLIGGAAVAVLAIAGVGIGIGVSGGSSKHTVAPLPHPPAASGTELPPWPAPADPTDGAKLAGLRVLNAEGEALHFHSHLDIFVDGKAVPVAAEIGIGQATGATSEMHTHDALGVIHIEAPDTKHRYVLGQFFDEWNVHLDTRSIGDLSNGGGKTLTAYVNGKPVTGDPAQIELTAHREIALVFGKPNSVKVPTSYAWTSGL